MSLAAQPLTPSSADRILVVEDDPNLREALFDTLALSDYDVLLADSAESALAQLAEHSDVRLIVSDVNMGQLSGYDLLRQVNTDYPHIPLVLITAYASIADSVTAIKEGAVDYLVKPFDPDTLLETVGRHLGGISDREQPVARAPASRQLLQLAERVAQSESTVLIIGESGTGKEVLARYIHNHSPRREEPFIAINCAAIPENMLEATLFGHEKGAYTGAHTSQPGKFEQANGGTLLLDELSEMDVGLQAKLLRVLQEQEVERLGGRKTISLNVRVIATSNRDMRAEVMAGRFREDLYYRLSVLPLEWAPLRDRVEDILPLAEKLLERHARKQNRRGVAMDASARRALETYRWPGNVRELDNVMQRALILQPGATISADNLGLTSTVQYSEKPSLLDPVSQCHGQSAELADDTAQAQDEAPVLGSDLKRREYEIIVQTLQEEGGSRKNTAQRLGISPRTLRYKIARLKDDGFDL